MSVLFNLTFTYYLKYKSVLCQFKTVDSKQTLLSTAREYSNIYLYVARYKNEI